MDSITIKITMPFDPELSKNKRYAYYKSKRKNPNHQAAQNAIQALFHKEYASKGKTALKLKTRVDLTLFRPHKRIDASNFVNPVNDALFKVLPYEDNLCHGTYNYFEDPSNPRFEINITFHV